MKKNYHIAKLNFSSGFHLGSRVGEEYDRSMTLPHSDMLSAALCSVWASLGGEVEPFLHSFRLSSAMPIYNGRLFLPLPPDKTCITLSDYPDGSLHKRIKRLCWVEQPLWERLAVEGHLEIDTSMISGCGRAIACSDASDIHIFRQVLEKKVKIVDGDDNEPYFFDRVFLGKGVSFGVLYTSDSVKDFERAFLELSENGLGTRRTVGNGLFEVVFDEVLIDVAEQATSVQLLSLWLPTAEEWNVDTMASSCYELLTRGGYISGSSEVRHRNKIKKSVQMLGVGGVIANPSIEGAVVDVRPDGFTAHPVWRDGRAFSLPFVKCNQL